MPNLDSRLHDQPQASKRMERRISALGTREALTPANISPNLAAGRNNSEIVMPAASSVQPGSWVLSTHTLDSSGRAFNAATIKACQGSDPTQACQAALGRLHLRDLITYQ